MAKDIENSSKSMHLGSIIFIVIVLAVISSFCYLYFQVCNPRNCAEESAKVALLASNSESDKVNIITISKPDSVFNNVFISDDDKQKISNILMSIQQRVLEKTNNLENLDKIDDSVNDLMLRQMSAMAILRSMDKPLFNQSEPSSQKFTGWRVKIAYESKSVYGHTIHTEYWALLDKSGKHVINSFEIPLD